MLTAFSNWLVRQAKVRRKAPERLPARGWRALWQRPAVGWAYWFLVWLAVVLLQMAAGEFETVHLTVGQPSPATVVAAVEFKYPLGLTLNGRRPFMQQVPRGTVLAVRGQTVTEEMAARFRAYQAQADEIHAFQRRVRALGGDALLLLVGIVISAGFFALTRTEPARRNATILLFLCVSLLSLVPAKWCLWLDHFYRPLPASSVAYLLPLALAPLLAAMLMNPPFALIVGFWVSFAAAVLAGHSFTVFTIGLVAAVVVARAARGVRSRAAVLRVGLWTGLAGAVCALGFAAVTSFAWDVVLKQCAISVAGGFLSALVALTILPLMEALFGVTTDISLLEISDMEHPLLKRLAIEAPGTYHHSLMVAHLAQAAVAAIGGHPLRAKICAYFHDVGKLVKPEFFVENNYHGDNPHDELSPSMSTLVIISHVKEGVNLALRYKLPQPVTDAIQQHHGTSLVSYFYHKASVLRHRESGAGRPRAGAALHERDFRYPGPKPRGREIAVLSLADAIEAASRSLEKITPGHIEHLVHDLVDARLEDGQLDLCDLTLAEIGQIKRVFIFTLTNMLHGRLSYPADEHRPKQPTNASASERGPDPETGALAHGASLAS